MISILMPVHADTADKALWLSEAIASVMQQTYKDWELVIVDDCSAVPLDRLESEQVRWVKTAQRSGPALCRNSAAALARGEVLLALDADDLLASLDTLQTLASHYQEDRVVYGDLEKYERNADGSWSRGKVVQFGEYDFRRSLDPRGLIPVTALHSKACWQAVGGWKPELAHGLEDVEYWIAAGERGYCGLHIPQAVLLYRRHPDSRTMRMRGARGQEGDMRQRIVELHKESYEGRYPVGCCGGGGTRSSGNPPVVNKTRAVAVTSQFRGDETVWVQYKGKLQGRFGLVAPATGTSYWIEGPGTVIAIHVTDADFFRRQGRGQHFAVGVAPPASAVARSAPPPQPAAPAVAPAPPPQMATLERLDRVASREAVNKKGGALSALDLGPIGDMLEAESWDIEKLALADPSELTGYKGIGKVRAEQIVRKAREAAKGV